MELEGLVWTLTFKLFWQEKFIIIGHVRYSKSKPSFNMAWWLPKVKKGEVIGLERRFLCVSWFARYDKSFALDPFDQKKREKNGWWCWPASFFPIKIQVDDRHTGHTGDYGIHWILFFSMIYLNHFQTYLIIKKTFWVLIFFFNVLLWTRKGYNMIDVSTK